MLVLGVAVAGVVATALKEKGRRGDREKALAAGATDYVTKPVDPDRLLAVVNRWLPAQKRRAELTS